jgi:hypothetical protein
MRSAEKSTCSAVGNPLECFFDARISKSINNLASRERTGKPAFLIIRLAQSRRENINLFPRSRANSLSATGARPEARGARKLQARYMTVEDGRCPRRQYTAAGGNHRGSIFRLLVGARRRAERRSPAACRSRLRAKTKNRTTVLNH